MRVPVFIVWRESHGFHDIESLQADRRSFDYASRDETAKGSAQDDTFVRRWCWSGLLGEEGTPGAEAPFILVVLARLKPCPLTVRFGLCSG
jgi:hypothetical protein